MASLNELERQGEIDRQGTNPVYPTQQIGITIPANTTIQDYLDTVNSDGLVKDSALSNGTISSIVAGTVEATSNGLGKNFKVGDDAYIGDINKTNTIVVAGIVNGDRGFIQFGSGSQPSIGHNGGGGFPAAGTATSGSILTTSGHLYFYNGTSGNGGWAQVI
jgi:hypothetical protein